MARRFLLDRSMDPVNTSRRSLLGQRASDCSFRQHFFGEINRLANRRPRFLTHAESKAIK